MGRIIIQSMCNIPTLMSRNAKRATAAPTAGSSCATMVEAAASSQRRRQSLPQIQPPALRRRKQRRRSASQCELRETQCGHLPSLKTPERLPTKVQIPRKLFNLVKAIFNEHDHDRDGFITEEEFVAAVTRADERKAEQEAERIKRRFHDKNVGETVGALAAQRSVIGTKHHKMLASFHCWILLPCISRTFHVQQFGTHVRNMQKNLFLCRRRRLLPMLWGPRRRFSRYLRVSRLLRLQWVLTAMGLCA